MKKHVVWLLLLALLLTTAVAVAANESDTGGAVQNTVRSVSSQTEGGCTIGTWSAIGSLVTARSRTGAAYSSATNSFFVLGGEAAGGNRNIPIEEYDSGTNTWSDQTLLTPGVSNTGAVGVGNYIYVPGGFDGAAAQTAMQRYDPVANTMSTVAALPTGNYAHAVAALGTDIYVLGGSSTGVAGTTNMIYDTVANSWSTGAALLTAVQYPAAATDGTYVYVLGGNTTNLTTVQRYDPGANSWTTIASMTTGRGGAGAFFDGQNIWAIGGGWTTYLTSTEYWDGAAWTAGPTANTGVRTVGAAFGNGLGMKAGGWNGAYSAAAETITIDCGGPGIAIEKSPDLQTIPVNGTANFTITVTNTGQVALDDVTVTDALAPDCDNNLGTLAGGASSSYTCSLANVASTFVNTAVVTSTQNNEPGPSASDDATVEVVDASLAIEKSPDLQTVTSGGTANFTITVTNTGSVQLNNVNVTDALVPACDSAIGTLAAGASNSYTCSDVGVTATYTNTAVVTGEMDAGPTVTASDDAVVEVSDPTGVSLTGFGSERAALSPLWLALALGILLGFGLLLRRRFIN